MVNSFICHVVYTYGLLRFSWQSFKLLKTNSLLHRLYSDASQKPALLNSFNLFKSFNKFNKFNSGDEKNDEKGDDLSNLETLKKMIEARQVEMKEMLQFWAVFSILTLYDFYLEFIISFWMPFYYTLKLIFLIYIILPETKGASVAFTQIIVPKFQQHESFIDNVLLPRISLFFRKVVGIMETVLFASVSKGHLTSDQIDELCAQYEKRVIELKKEKASRIANAATTSPVTGFFAESKVQESKISDRNYGDVEAKIEETYFQQFFSRASPKAKTLQTFKTAEDQSDNTTNPNQGSALAANISNMSRSLAAFGLDGVLGVAVNTRNLLFGNEAAISSTDKIFSEQNAFLQAQEGRARPSDNDTNAGDKNTNILNSVQEKKKKKSSSDEFETLLEEFDDSDDNNKYLNVKSVRNRMTRQETNNTATTYSEESDSDLEKDDNGLRFRGKGQERMSLHRPKRYNTRSQARN